MNKDLKVKSNISGCSGDRCIKPKGNNGYALLRNGDRLTSKNGKYVLRMQRDGNLVLYCNGKTPIWVSGTYRKTVLEGLHFQHDSNLVLYDKTGPIWASMTHGTGASKLIVQNDGNVVLYTPSNKPVWATNTQNKC